MTVVRLPIIYRYVIAVLITAASIGFTLLIRLIFSLNPTPVLLLALVAAAWYGGRVPGLLSALLLDLSIDFFFDDTPYAFSNPSGHVARLLVLVVISLLATSRRRAQDRLVNRERQQAAVARLGQVALSKTPWAELLPMAADLVRTTLDVDHTAVCEIMHDEKKLCYVSAAGFDDDVVGYKFDYNADHSLAGYVLKTGGPVTISDLKKEATFVGSPVLSPYSIRSMIGVNIIQRDGPFGVIGAFQKSPRDFSKDDTNFLQAIANILGEARERLRSEEAISEQRNWLKTTLWSIGDGVIATDRAGMIMFMNPIAEHLTEWTESEAVGRELSEVFDIYSEDTGEPIVNPVETVTRTGSIVGLANHTLLKTKSGREIPIADSAAPIIEGEDVKGIVLVFSDMSERRLAELNRRESETMKRLVEAQESERHRIARDLHDHLGQQMTALRLRVESLMNECTQFPSLGNSLNDVQKAAVKIDRDIGFLSWELRPTELDHLGLENALGSYVREWSNQFGIDAEFHADLPSREDRNVRLPRVVETNLYRIVQEALNNILKHAEAEHVSVLLHQRKNSIALVIEDDGRGFDADAGTNNNGSSVKGGFGLTGMNERASLMKGELEIESSRDGTTVLVSIPLPNVE